MIVMKSFQDEALVEKMRNFMKMKFLNRNVHMNEICRQMGWNTTRISTSLSRGTLTAIMERQIAALLGYDVKWVKREDK